MCLDQICHKPTFFCFSLSKSEQIQEQLQLKVKKSTLSLNTDKTTNEAANRNVYMLSDQLVFHLASPLMCSRSIFNIWNLWDVSWLWSVHCTCSGLMYSWVPTSAVCLAEALLAGDWSLFSGRFSAAVTRPKSPTFTVPSRAKKMLDGWKHNGCGFHLDIWHWNTIWLIPPT